MGHTFTMVGLRVDGEKKVKDIYRYLCLDRKVDQFKILHFFLKTELSQFIPIHLVPAFYKHHLSAGLT